MTIRRNRDGRTRSANIACNRSRENVAWSCRWWPPQRYKTLLWMRFESQLGNRNNVVMELVSGVVWHLCSMSIRRRTRRQRSVTTEAEELKYSR
jgi:hypothetical protein